jgi:hypothetical protein
MSNTPWDALKADEVIAEIAAIYEPILRTSRTYNEFNQIKQQQNAAMTAALTKRFGFYESPAPQSNQGDTNGT